VPGESNLLDITRVIQLAIAPVFLLTAIGTIINVLTQRLARALDRRRIIEEQVPHIEGDALSEAEVELGLLNRRIVLVLWAIALAVLAGTLVCLLIGVAFAGAFIAMNLARIIAGLFIGAVAVLTGALLLFLREVLIAAWTAHRGGVPYQFARVERTKDTAAAK
jgi:MFS family permease